MHDSAGVENGSNPTTVSSTTTPLVIKMMTDYASWRREIESREILASAQSSIIPVDSVASASKETPDQIGGLTVLRKGSISVERELQGLATKLMLQYPYALCMERAEKNLLECISNDRLATEPLVIIRSIVSKIGSCMSALHKLGVVHGDCKPRNICRLADNSFRLIDFDMAFAPALAATAKGLPNVHATAGKIEGTNAYVAPELFRWSRESASTAPGSEQALKLEDAIKLDIWSFGYTVYESVTGISLAQHIYDVATDQGEERLLKWTGLHKAEDAQLRKLHEGQDTTGLLDLLHWMLAPDPAERPGSMEVVLEHAFFQPGKGSMREHFVVDRIKQLLPVTDEDRASRKYGNVMISYCWANTTVRARPAVPCPGPAVPGYVARQTRWRSRHGRVDAGLHDKGRRRGRLHCLDRVAAVCQVQELWLRDGARSQVQQDHHPDQARRAVQRMAAADDRRDPNDQPVRRSPDWRHEALRGL